MFVFAITFGAATYTAFSFYWWSAYPGDWSEVSRGLFGFMLMVDAVISMLIHHDFLCQHDKHEQYAKRTPTTQPPNQ